MASVIKEKIIIPAWEMIKNDTQLKSMYFIPGIFSIIFLTALLVYQSIYTYVELFGKKEEALLLILEFLHSEYVLEVFIVLGIFLIAYIILIPIFEGSLIQYIHAKYHGKKLGIGESLSLGLYNFLPIFEYNNMFSEFKIISIINGYLFIIRFLGIEYITYINYVFLIIFIIGMIINIFFSYAKYEIILKKKGIFKSIATSSKLSILNFTMTIKLYFIILFLNIRVIFNFIIFLSFPIIIVIAIGFITSKVFLFLTITMLSILFILFILLLGYLTAVLEVFTKSIWYYGYKQGEKKIDNIKD